MRAWKGLIIFVLAVGLLGYFACKGGGKYSDVKDVMSESLEVMNSFAAAMEKAGDAKAVAKAITAFTEDMVELKPRLQAMEKKYPEIKDQASAPEELKDVMKKGEEASTKMMNSMMKLYQYAQDPDVQKASEAMQKAMQD